MFAEKFGYYFHPARHPNSPGHPQPEINIYETPTGQHFDPEQVSVWLLDSAGDLVETTIRHGCSGYPPQTHTGQAYAPSPKP